MLKLLSYILFCFVLSCTTQKKIEPLPIPKWVLSEYNSTTELYGLGQGLTFEEAKKKALNNLISKITITISSESSIQTAATDIANITEYRSHTKEKIKKINIRNFEIVKQEQFRGDIYILLKVKKQKIFNDYKEKLLDLFKKFKEDYKKIKISQIFYIKQNYLQKIINKNDNVMNILSILKGLNNTFNSQTYINQFNIYNNEYQKIVKNIIVIINNKNYPQIVNQVKQYLINQSISINSKAQPNTYNLYLKFKVKKINTKLFGIFNNKYTLELRSVDKNNTDVAIISLNFNGNSSINQNNALNNAMINLKKELKFKKIIKKLKFN